MSASYRVLPLAELVQRVRNEYRDMPSLRLTPSQAARLFAVGPSVCAALLEALVNEHFLSRTADGLFVRSSDWLTHLPEEAHAVIQTIVRRNPSKDRAALVSDVMLALSATGRLVEIAKAFGNPQEFVGAISDDVTRLKAQEDR